MLGSALQGIAERTVVRAGVLRRVTQDGRVGVARRIKGLADDRNTSVHHVGRTNAVKSRFRLDDRHVGQDGEREVVDDLAFLDDTVVAIRTVRIHRHVAHQPRLREAILDGAREA